MLQVGQNEISLRKWSGGTLRIYEGTLFASPTLLCVKRKRAAKRYFALLGKL